MKFLFDLSVYFIEFLILIWKLGPNVFPEKATGGVLTEWILGFEETGTMYHKRHLLRPNTYTDCFNFFMLICLILSILCEQVPNIDEYKGVSNSTDFGAWRNCTRCQKGNFWDQISAQIVLNFFHVCLSYLEYFEWTGSKYRHVGYFSHSF